MNPENLIQQRITGNTGATLDPNNFLFNKLGDDGLRENTLYATSALPVYHKTWQSARQFINYGLGDTETFIDADNVELSSTNMSYGFATCTSVEEYDYAVHTNTSTIQYEVKDNVLVGATTIVVNLNIEQAGIIAQNQVLGQAESVPFTSGTLCASVSAVVSQTQTITLSKPTILAIAANAYITLTIPESWQPVTKIMKYITFHTDKVGGIQANIKLPITITNVYGPTSMAEENDQIHFNTKLNIETNRPNRQGPTITMGYFNIIIKERITE